MRFKTPILIATVLVCVGLGLWQRENLSVIWREYSSLYRHTMYEDYSMRMRGPFIPAKVAKDDPEAAAVAEMKLGQFNFNEEQAIQPIAEKLLQYPDNRFLLFEILRGLGWYNSVIDRQIALKLVDRLIALEPDNAHYHYAKCYLLFADRRDNDIDAALAELEYANKCKRYDPLWDVFRNLPYDSYKQRVIEIADKAKLCRFLMTYLQRLWPVSFDITHQLVPYASAAFTNGDKLTGMRIINALTEKGDTTGYSFGRFVHLPLLELQRVDLTKERAKENRLALCARMITSEKTVERSKEQDLEESRKKAIKEQKIQDGAMAAYPAVHFGQMFVALSCGCVILLLICIIRGFGERTRVGFTEVLLFLFGNICYFCIVKFIFLGQIFESLGNNLCGCCCYFSYIDALRPILGLQCIEHELIPASLILAGPIVAAFALWGLGYLRPKRGAFWRLWYVRVLGALGIGGIATFIFCTQVYIEPVSWQGSLVVGLLFSVPIWVIITFAWWLYRCRIVRLILLAAFLGFMTFMLNGYRYVHYLPMIVFVLVCAIIVAVKPDEGSALKTTLQFFNRRPDIAAIRKKSLRLTVPFTVFYWVLFVMLTPLVARGIILEYGEFRPVDRRKALLEPNEAYKELMSKFGAEGLSKMGVWRLLGLVMPEDLPGLLQKLKKKEFLEYRWEILRKDASEKDKAEWERKREHKRWLNDDDLVSAMESCGRDVVDIITGFLDNPDAERALVARAKLRDRTAKEKLEEFLQVRIQGELEKKEDEQAERYEFYLDTPVEVADIVEVAEIIGALACISEPNEVAGWFLDYIQNREVCVLIEEYEFLNNISLLPRPQACRVIKAYLEKVRSWQPHEEPTLNCSRRRHSWRDVLNPLCGLAGFYGDRQIAEKIFEIMLAAISQEDDFEPINISPYFDGRSAELIKKGLDHGNAGMRAWCVWQLRKIGYEFSASELERLLKDESWKVRTNATFAGGKEARALAKSDRNAFVRLIANF